MASAWGGKTGWEHRSWKADEFCVGSTTTECKNTLSFVGSPPHCRQQKFPSQIDPQLYPPSAGNCKVLKLPQPATQSACQSRVPLWIRDAYVSVKKPAGIPLVGEGDESSYNAQAAVWQKWDLGLDELLFESGMPDPVWEGKCAL